MKDKVINKNTNQQFDCEEIEIKGFKYYTIDTAVGCKYGISKLNEVIEIKIGYDATLYKGIICTTNPSIDLPKVVDEIERLSKDLIPFKQDGSYQTTRIDMNHEKRKGFIEGYNKFQETHPFSEEDMIDFAEWSQICQWNFNGSTKIWWSILYTNSFPTTQELLQLWKEQQPKIVWYEI